MSELRNLNGETLSEQIAFTSSVNLLEISSLDENFPS